ncbi:hypothetical protein PRIPAC_78483 [Pristionchus pacificus]|uniref:Cyp-33C1 n=1 Tax=Pristionchus pacificus TaxID=54126 RepID=A0A2A6BY51_PRIPA|nr:hypothetical protein PRIPAC_78483 [Pristionchus pacificus]|eukprot:PDM70799.1 cyp-33C1 [Pristionchus pacificus]
MLLLLISAVGLYFFYHLYWKRRGLPPGPTPWPILGNLPGLIKKAPGYEAIKDWKSEFGPVFTYWYGANPVVTINDYDILKDTVLADASAYTDRFIPSEILRLYRGGEWGVIDTSGPLWTEHRRFALKTLRDFGMGKNLMEEKVAYFPVPALHFPALFQIQTEIVALMDNLRAEGDQPIDLHSHLDLAVGGIINNTLLGHRFDESNMAEFRKLRHLLEEQSRVINKPSFLLLMLLPSMRRFPYLRDAWKTIMDCRDNLYAFLREQIISHEREIDLDREDDPTDICEAYLRERKRRTDADGTEGLYSLKQLENLLFDLWVGGLETTTGNLGWAAVFLIHHPEVQKRMREEMATVVGKDGPITTAHRSRLPYCGAVLMELQRLVNIVPLNLPRTTTRDVTIGGYSVSKGTAVMPQISAILYEEKIFPDPHSFKPDRFITEDGKLNNMDEWIPFSLGARRCPGESLAKMELFLFLTNLIHNFEISAESPDKIPSMVKTGATVSKPEKHLVKLTRMI